MILLDTNILARMTAPSEPNSRRRARALHSLRAGRERLIIVPQNLYGFWAVATRKRGPPPSGQNGLGMTVKSSEFVAGLFPAPVSSLA